MGQDVGIRRWVIYVVLGCCAVAIVIQQCIIIRQGVSAALAFDSVQTFRAIAEQAPHSRRGAADCTVELGAYYPQGTRLPVGTIHDKTVEEARALAVACIRHCAEAHSSEVSN